MLSPVEYAKQYAIDKCWDNVNRVYLKKECVVLEATVKIREEKFLDLTDLQGLKLFNNFRYQIIKKIENSGKSLVGSYRDTDVLKIMRDGLGIEFVKSNVYIKFASQRRGKMESLIPNVTVLVVNNPTKYIAKPTIKEIDKFEIKV